MHILACQLDSAWEEKKANFAMVRGLLATAETAPGSLIVLPEMFATGFSLNLDKMDAGAEDLCGEFMRELARDEGSWVLGGVGTRGSDGKGLNQAFTFGPDGKLVNRYAKLHPFTFGGEPKCFAAGRTVELFEWQGIKVAPFICYDLRFPEAFRLAVRRGAELLVVMANFPTSRVEHWAALLVARAIENQAYVLGVNRCGEDPQFKYPGRSMIVDPRGKVIAEAGGDPEVIAADLDIKALREYRASFPALQDIRAELLGQ